MTWGFGVVGFIIGIHLGSLALALAHRSLENRTFFGRSSCPHCNHKLSGFDLIPIISYLALGGKCRYCHKKIKIEYILVELVMGLALGLTFYFSFLKLPVSPDQYGLVNFLFDLILKTFMITVLMIVAITDLKKTLIPDRITYPAAVIVLVSLVAISAYRIWVLFQSLNANSVGNFLIFKTDYFLRHAFLTALPLWGGIIMALVLGLAFLLLIVLTKGRGMGGGDLKLGILIGLFFGFPQALVSIMLAFFLGSIFAIALIIFGKKRFGQTIPFGPFLSLGAFLTILYGGQIMDWYLNFKLI